MMNWLPWILVVAMGYEVQCQAYSGKGGRGDDQPRGINSLYFAFRFSIFELGSNISRNEHQTVILLASLANWKSEYYFAIKAQAEYQYTIVKIAVSFRFELFVFRFSSRD